MMRPASSSGARRRSPLLSFSALLTLGGAALSGCSLDVEGRAVAGGSGAGGMASTSSSTGSLCDPGTTKACYNGPEGTRGVGLCKEGIETCNPDGSGYGGCVGEVGPAAEDCTTLTTDEDCDGHSSDDDTDCVCKPGMTEDCPTGLQGVCSQGTRTCTVDGNGFGTCSPKSTPTFDDCNNAVDEDCDGNAVACMGTPIFGKSYGTGTTDDLGYAVATDSVGNVIVGGSQGNSLWLIKVDPAGNKLWEKVVPVSGGGNPSGRVSSIATNVSDEILIGGYFDGQIDLGGGTPLNSGGMSTEGLAAKFSKDGAHIWSKQFGDGMGGMGDQYINAVAFDGAGNIFWAGGIAGTVTFGVTTLPSTMDGFDAFVAKLNNNGDLTWAKRTGMNGSQYVLSIAITSEGDALITGPFQGSMDFGGGNITSTGGTDAFLIKLKGNDGSTAWAKGFGASGQNSYDQRGEGVAIDPKGVISISGFFQKTITLDDMTLTTADMSDQNYDLFVATYDGAGKLLWTKRFGDAATQVSKAIAVDKAGNIVVTGYFRSQFDFGGGVLTTSEANGAKDVFVAKLGAAGQHLWSKRYGGIGDDESSGIAVDYKGNVFVTGQFANSIDVGGSGGTLTSAGKDDAFLIGLAP